MAQQSELRGMNRRRFLQLSSLIGVGAATGLMWGCNGDENEDENENENENGDEDENED